MNSTNLKNLAVLTLTDPAEAARQLMAMNLGREVLWVAFALAIVLNTLLQTASNVVFPVIDSEFQGIANSLVLYVAIVGGGLFLSILAFYHVGRRMGGTGSFNDIMVLMVWLQFLRVAVQAAGLIFLMTIPVLSALLAFAAFVVGLYITVHFLDQAHRLGSLPRAVGVLFLSVLAIAALLILVLSLVGAPMLGLSAHV